MKKKIKHRSKYKKNKKDNSSKKAYFALALLVAVSIFGVYFVLGGFTGIGSILSTDPVVCIDAGHGGNDVGASSDGRNEKDDNLRLAQAVKTQLEAKGIRVVMTRDDDRYISLDDRCKKANRSRADLFVALHRNSAKSGSGVEIWVNSDPSETDNNLADNILIYVDRVGISQNRGVKSGYVGGADKDYYVNKNTKMPSCLVEMGFITNKEDNELFDENLNEYANAIAQGIYDTLNNS